MKKIRYTILTIVTFLACITNTYAACTQEEKDAFKRVEDKYTIKYEIDRTTKKYTLYLERAKPDKYEFVIYTDESIKCEDVSDTLSKCYPFASGEHEFSVAGQTESCNDILKTTIIKLPKYNTYADDPLCQGIEEFVLCNPVYDKEIDRESFESRVATYKKNKLKNELENEKSKNEKDNQNNEYITKILDYIKENMVQIIIIIVFIILVVITLIVTAKSIRKSRRLE